jgi:hypothetical protein
LAEDLLERLQRNAVVSCAVMTVGALAITRDWRAGLAVVGGGALVATSFFSIRSGIDAMAARRRAGRAVLMIAGRYALLGFLAYVMIVRLRLPPLGLIAGASSVVTAAAVEAARVLRKKT